MKPVKIASNVSDYPMMNTIFIEHCDWDSHISQYAWLHKPEPIPETIAIWTIKLKKAA